MAMVWHDVYKDFHPLSKTEQMEQFKAVQQDLFPESKADISKMVGEVRETRFSNGLACVHCGSTAVKRNGNIVQANAIFVKIVANLLMI